MLESRPEGPTALDGLSAVLARLSPYEERGRALHRETRNLLIGLVRHARLRAGGPPVVLLFGGANTGKSSLAWCPRSGLADALRIPVIGDRFTIGSGPLSVTAPRVTDPLGEAL